jgi:RHS repeat-associated protein
VLGIARANGGAVLKSLPDRVGSNPLLPWGQEPADTGFIVRYRMAGQEYDQETALYHMGARYFDPVLGRWLSEDPAGIAGGTNLCAYAANDPVNGRDPSGGWSCTTTYDTHGQPAAYHCHWTAADCRYLTQSFEECGYGVGSNWCGQMGGIFDMGDCFVIVPYSGPLDPTTGDGWWGRNQGSQQLQSPPPTKACVGSARVMQGRAGTIGGRGGFSGSSAGIIPVTANGVAVIPSQWGGKGTLRP